MKKELLCLVMMGLQIVQVVVQEGKVEQKKYVKNVCVLLVPNANLKVTAVES